MDSDPSSDIQWVYEIKVEGRLDERWSGWFAGLTITFEEGSSKTLPVTTLKGAVADQAALRGILTALWNLNLDLITAARLEAC
jgi:hypothetical protein